MNGVEFIVFISKIIIISLTLTIPSQSSGESKPKKGPGISSCKYYGNFKLNGIENYRIPIRNIPDECTSIFVEDFTVDSDYKVTYTKNFGDDQGLLDDLLKYGKSVYVIYGQRGPRIWAYVFGCDGSNAENNINNNMKGLKAFMDAHPGIKGLILNELNVFKFSSECKEYTDHLVTYIKAMREMFPKLEIGMKIYGNSLLDDCAKQIIKFFDFKVLDNYLDFYVIGSSKSNRCEPEFRVGGTTPVSGDASYTLTKVQKCLNKINVPSEKSYYNIEITATSDNTYDNSYVPYQQFCTSPHQILRYCADTTQSLFEKGQFIKQTAAGFVVAYIDFADPNNACHCVRPFQPFYNILGGINGSPAPESCKSMDNRFNGVYRTIVRLGSSTRR